MDQRGLFGSAIKIMIFLTCRWCPNEIDGDSVKKWFLENCLCGFDDR